MKKLIFILIAGLSGCIGVDVVDDFIGSNLVITNPVSTLPLGNQYEFSHRFTNSIGEIVQVTPVWNVSDEDIITIDANGTVTPQSEGWAWVSASYLDDETFVSDTVELIVSEATEMEIEDSTSTIRSGTIVTTSSYILEGDFSISNIEGGIRIEIAENYKTTDVLPGLVIYITNNPNTINPDVSYEVANVTVFEGAHSYDVIQEGLDINTYDYLLYYCKPFVVKVGEGKLE